MLVVAAQGNVFSGVADGSVMSMVSKQARSAK